VKEFLSWSSEFTTRKLINKAKSDKRKKKQILPYQTLTKNQITHKCNRFLTTYAIMSFKDIAAQ